MMRDCGILYGNFSASSSRSSRVREGPISTVDIDLIFTRLSNKPNSNGRLDFRQFLKALHEIATKAFIDAQSEDCLMHLLDEYILKLDQGSDNIRGVSSKYVKGLMDMLKDDEVIEALSLVHRSIIYYYRYYANSRGNMSFDNFIRFCRDFGIFPDLIPKAKLLRFFYTLSSIHAQTEQPEISVCSAFNDEATLNKSPDEVIDEHLFVEALALIAAEVLYKEPEPNAVERICYLMERLGQSDGPQKVMIACGHNRAAAKESQDMTAFLRQRYPEVFQEYNPARVNFGDLMTQIAEDM
jgi:hypothetical protein